MEDSEGSKLRPSVCELGILSRCDGSVQLCQGDTTVIVGVYGPGEVKISREQIDKATVEVNFRSKVGQSGVGDRSKEQFVESCCCSSLLTALYPRTLISLTVHELQNSGSLLAAAVNACCLCLLDAAVPMRHLLAAVSVATYPDNTVVVDPSSEQEEEAEAVVTVVVSGRGRDGDGKRQVVSVKTRGLVKPAMYDRCVALGVEASQQIFDMYRRVLEKKLTRLPSLGKNPQ